MPKNLRQNVHTQNIHCINMNTFKTTTKERRKIAFIWMVLPLQPISDWIGWRCIFFFISFHLHIFLNALVKCNVEKHLKISMGHIRMYSGFTMQTITMSVCLCVSICVLRIIETFSWFEFLKNKKKKKSCVTMTWIHQEV